MVLLRHPAADGGDDVRAHRHRRGRGLDRGQGRRQAMSVGPLMILGLLLGSMAATVPVFMALFFAGLAGLMWGAGIDPQIVIEVLYRSMDKFALVVVLFFVLCGNIMTTGTHRRAADQRFANVLVELAPGRARPWPGSLACGFFGAISGSTVATVVAIGGFMIPALLDNGYDRCSTRVGAHVHLGPILGIIIPPSRSRMIL
ncbi:MAG: TRAP transporter permease [Anaerotruncus sp.]|nr:TRAP transporter permease [Anaerotruncus sp.]